MADKTSSVDTNIEWKTDSYAIDVNKEEIVYLESYKNKYEDTSLRPTEITAARLTSSNSDKNGYTLLCWACAKGAPPEVIAYLLSNNAYSGKCAKGKTPIQLACLSMNVDAIKILLGNQIDYEVKEYNENARTEISKEPKQIAKTADTSNNKLDVSSKDLLTAATLPESDENLLTVLVEDVIKRIVGMDQSYELIDNGDLYKQIHSLIEYTCGTDNYGNTLLILATQAQNYASVDCLKNLNLKYGLISTDIETKADVPVKSDHKKIALYIAEDILEDDGIKNKILSFYRSEGVLNKFSNGNLTLDNLLIDGFYSVFKKLIYDVSKIKSASNPTGKNDLSWFNNDTKGHRLDAFELAYSYSDADDKKTNNESPFGFSDIKIYENIVYKLATSLSYKLADSNFKEIDNTKGSDSTALSNVYTSIKNNYTSLTPTARKKTLMTRLLDSISENLVSSLFGRYTFIGKDDFEYSLANSSKYHKSTDCDKSCIGYIVASKIVDHDEYEDILKESIVKNRLSYLLVDVYNITNDNPSKRTNLCQIILASEDNRKPIIIDDLNLTGEGLYNMLYTLKKDSSDTYILSDQNRADIVDYSLSRLCYNELSNLIGFILEVNEGQTRDNIKWLDDNIGDLTSFTLPFKESLFYLVVDNDCSNVLDKSYATFDKKEYYYKYVNNKLRYGSLGNKILDGISKYYGDNIGSCINYKAHYILQKLYDDGKITGDNYKEIDKLSYTDLNIVYKNYKHAMSSNWTDSLLYYAAKNKLYKTINYIYKYVGLDEFELTKLRDWYKTTDEKPNLFDDGLWEDLFPKPPESEDPSEDPIENKPPVVIVSTSFTCNSESSIVIDASSSHDIEDDSLTFNWTGSGSSYLNSRSISNPTFTAPIVLHDTAYQLTVTATDSGGLSSSKTVTVQCIASKNIGIYAFTSGTFAVETDSEIKMCTTTKEIKTVKSEWEKAYAEGYTSQQVPKEPYSLIYDVDATVTNRS